MRIYIQKGKDLATFLSGLWSVSEKLLRGPWRGASNRNGNVPESGTLANKLQLLVLHHPEVAEKVEQLVDRLLTDYGIPR